MTPLITIDEFKTYKGITTSDEDNKILQIINNVSNIVRHFCGREITTYYSTDLVQVFDGSFSTLYLQEFPLKTVTSVELSTDYGKTYTVLTEFENYLINYEQSAITTGTSTPFSASPITMNAVKVTYTGGYEECPEDLKIACFDMVEYYREGEYIPKKTMSGATSDNEVFRLMRSERFPIHIQRILNLYRAVI